MSGAAGTISETKSAPRDGNHRGHDTETLEVSMPNESSSLGPRQGHPVSDPIHGEPEWATRARELRQMGWSFKRICAEVGHGHSAVHYWVAPTGGATKRNRPDHLTRTVQCGECGSEFKTSPSRNQKYCSPSCYSARGRRSPEGTEAVRQKLRAQRKGKNNPQYKHGRYVGRKTKELEKTFNLKKKGESACRNCGDDRPGCNAHHAVPRSISPAGRLDLRNCLPLCPSCHMAWHRGRPITRDCFTQEEWEFVSTLIGGPWLDKRYPEPDGEWGFLIR